MSNLLTESIHHGSIYQALQIKAVTVDQILQYLVKAPVDLRTTLAYRAACKYSHPDSHYIMNGEHKDRFLTVQPHQEYQLVYAYVTGIIDCTWDEIGDLSTGCIALMAKALRNDPSVDLRMRILCDLPLYDKTLPDLSPLFQARHPYMISLQAKTYILKHPHFAIQADWLDILPEEAINKSLLPMLMDRARDLLKVAPEYWHKVIRGEYLKIVRKISTGLKDDSTFTRDDWIKIREAFPEIYPELDVYSDLAWKISKHPPITQAYLLGFSIESNFPTDLMLRTALINLSKDGPDAYLKALPPFEFKLVNTTDTPLNPVADYSPYDRFIYRSGDVVYGFTRAEFPYILEKKLNPWDQQPIPEHILTLMECRLSMAKSLNLPTCEPLQSLYEMIEKSESIMESPSRKKGTDDPPMDEFFRQVFGRMMSM